MISNTLYLLKKGDNMASRLSHLRNQHAQNQALHSLWSEIEDQEELEDEKTPILKDTKSSSTGSLSLKWRKASSAKSIETLEASSAEVSEKVHWMIQNRGGIALLTG